MDVEKLLADYARAWVALHAKSLEGWNTSRIFDAFYMLPSPPVSFKEWVEARGHAQPMAMPEAPAPEPVASNDQIKEGPGWAIATGPEGEAALRAKIASLKALSERMQ